jgi:hypothetical protein
MVSVLFCKSRPQRRVGGQSYSEERGDQTVKSACLTVKGVVYLIVIYSYCSVVPFLDT